MSLTRTEMHTIVSVAVADSEAGPHHYGDFRVVARDIGATVGVGVYRGEKLVHSFCAHTRYVDRAEEIARDLIHESVEEVRRDRGVRHVFEYFAERFKAIAHERGHEPLDPQELYPEE